MIATNKTAAFDIQGARARVTGVLHFSTVTALLQTGSDAITKGNVGLIDLAGVQDSDSSGLALLIEWLSVAKSNDRVLRYENIPSQLKQLAGLSDIEDLLTAEKQVTS